MPEADVWALIDRVLEFLAISDERDEVVSIGSDFQSRAMLGDLDIWSIFSEGAPLALKTQIGQELAAWLGKAPVYVEEPEWPDGADILDIGIDGAPLIENADVAWVHHSVRGGRMCASFSLSRSGKLSTTTTVGQVDIFFVNSERERVAFWRDAIILEGDTFHALERLTPHAFPSLYFHDGALQGANGLNGGYMASKIRLKACLAVLNDYGAWCYTCPPPALNPQDQVMGQVEQGVTNQLLEARFRGLGIDVAPENPNVRQHRQSRIAREVSVGDRVLYCEWHAKLEPHQNRVHFHAPVPEAGDKLVIGMIAEHLPLP
jgi:hypothetical protein